MENNVKNFSNNLELKKLKTDFSDKALIKFIEKVIRSQKSLTRKEFQEVNSLLERENLEILYDFDTFESKLFSALSLYSGEFETFIYLISSEKNDIKTGADKDTPTDSSSLHSEEISSGIDDELAKKLTDLGRAETEKESLKEQKNYTIFPLLFTEELVTEYSKSAAEQYTHQFNGIVHLNKQVDKLLSELSGLASVPSEETSKNLSTCVSFDVCVFISACFLYSKHIEVLRRQLDTNVQEPKADGKDSNELFSEQTKKYDYYRLRACSNLLFITLVVGAVSEDLNLVFRTLYRTTSSMEFNECELRDLINTALEICSEAKSKKFSYETFCGFMVMWNSMLPFHKFVDHRVLSMVIKSLTPNLWEGGTDGPVEIINSVMSIIRQSIEDDCLDFENTEFSAIVDSSLNQLIDLQKSHGLTKSLSTWILENIPEVIYDVYGFECYDDVLRINEVCAEYLVNSAISDQEESGVPPVFEFSNSTIYRSEDFLKSVSTLGLLLSQDGYINLNEDVSNYLVAAKTVVNAGFPKHGLSLLMSLMLYHYYPFSEYDQKSDYGFYKEQFPYLAIESFMHDNGLESFREQIVKPFGSILNCIVKDKNSASSLWLSENSFAIQQNNTINFKERLKVVHTSKNNEVPKWLQNSRISSSGLSKFSTLVASIVDKSVEQNTHSKQLARRIVFDIIVNLERYLRKEIRKLFDIVKSSDSLKPILFNRDRREFDFSKLTLGAICNFLNRIMNLNRYDNEAYREFLYTLASSSKRLSLVVESLLVDDGWFIKSLTVIKDERNSYAHGHKHTFSDYLVLSVHACYKNIDDIFETGC